MANDAFSNYIENLIVDHQWRTATFAKPAALYFGLLSTAASDGVTVTELSGTGYARVAKTPGATDFTVSGNAVSNASAITFPSPGAAWGTATHMAIYDAASGGNLIAWSLLTASKVIGASDPAPQFAIGEFTFTYNSTSNALANKVLNHIFGATTWAKPTGLNFAFYTAAPSAAGGGTEVSGGSYARVTVAPSDANFAATQGGNTGASSGTGGSTANSAAITFPAPTANWGAVLAVGVFDNLGMFVGWGSFAAQNVNAGDAAPVIAIGALTWAIN